MIMSESTPLTNFVVYNSLSFSTLHTMWYINQMDINEPTALNNFVVYNSLFPWILHTFSMWKFNLIEASALTNYVLGA